MIPVSEMKIDALYQRQPDEKRVNRIADNWDDSKANLIHISRRADGDYVMDGNHTRLAYKKIGGDKLPCRVHYGLTPEEEAKFYYEMNTAQKKPKYAEVLKAKAAAGCKLEKTYLQCLEEARVPYSLAQGSGRKIRCHAALIAIYKTTTYHMFLRALKTALRAADERDEFYQTGYFPGLCSLIVRHPEIDDQRLIVKVKRTTATAVRETADVYKRAIVPSAVSGATRDYRKAYIDIYNKKLSRNRIEE